MSETLRVLRNRRERLNAFYDDAVNLELPSEVLNGIHAVVAELEQVIGRLVESTPAPKKKPTARKNAGGAVASSPKKRGRPPKTVEVAGEVASGNGVDPRQLPIGAHPLDKLAGRTLVAPADAVNGGAS